MIQAEKYKPFAKRDKAYQWMMPVFLRERLSKNTDSPDFHSVLKQLVISQPTATIYDLFKECFTEDRAVTTAKDKMKALLKASNNRFDQSTKPTSLSNSFSELFFGLFSIFDLDEAVSSKSSKSRPASLLTAFEAARLAKTITLTGQEKFLLDPYPLPFTPSNTYIKEMQQHEKVAALYSKPIEDEKHIYLAIDKGATETQIKEEIEKILKTELPKGNTRNTGSRVVKNLSKYQVLNYFDYAYINNLSPQETATYNDFLSSSAFNPDTTGDNIDAPENQSETIELATQIKTGELTNRLLDHCKRYEDPPLYFQVNY